VIVEFLWILRVYLVIETVVILCKKKKKIKKKPISMIENGVWEGTNGGGGFKPLVDHVLQSPLFKGEGFNQRQNRRMLLQKYFKPCIPKRTYHTPLL
jgi:hypothetical protein